MNRSNSLLNISNTWQKRTSSRCTNYRAWSTIAELLSLNSTMSNLIGHPDPTLFGSMSAPRQKKVVLLSPGWRLNKNPEACLRHSMFKPSLHTSLFRGTPSRLSSNRLRMKRVKSTRHSRWLPSLRIGDIPSKRFAIFILSALELKGWHHIANKKATPA